MTPDDRFRIRDIKKYTHSEIEEILFAADGRLTHKDGFSLGSGRRHCFPRGHLIQPLKKMDANASVFFISLFLFSASSLFPAPHRLSGRIPTGFRQPAKG